MNVGQTFPPVAVLAVAVPLVGFGQAPTLIALFAYGLLPIFENTIAGLESCPPPVLEAADGMGMSAWQRLRQVELPLALPLIMEGVRLSLVINVGTATLGSTVAAKGLGEVIIAGLLSNNTAFVLQGGLVTGLMAILLYDGMRLLEQRFVPVRTELNHGRFRRRSALLRSGRQRPSPGRQEPMSAPQTATGKAAQRRRGDARDRVADGRADRLRLRRLVHAHPGLR